MSHRRDQAYRVDRTSADPVAGPQRQVLIFLRGGAEQRASAMVGLVRWLNRERAAGVDLEFNPMESFGQVALRAPATTISRLATRTEVSAIVEDKATDVL